MGNPTERIKEMIRMRRSNLYFDYARQMYYEGLQPGKITKDIRLGELIGYAGFAYKKNPKNTEVSRAEQHLALQVSCWLYSVRRGLNYEKKIRLKELEEIIRQPARAYPPFISRQGISYFKKTLKQYGVY